MQRPAASRWLRFYAIFLLLVLLIWIPLEDFNAGFVIAFSAMLCGLAAAHYLLSHSADQTWFWLRHVWAGIASGLALTPVALALMIFKSGLHNHPSPEYTPYQMARVVESTPIWVSAGLLISFGVAIFRKVKSNYLHA